MQVKVTFKKNGHENNFLDRFLRTSLNKIYSKNVR